MRGPRREHTHGLSIVKEKLLRATSTDTVRSKVISGKPARMLETEWTEAWLEQGSPATLGIPLQGIVAGFHEAAGRVERARRPAEERAAE